VTWLGIAAQYTVGQKLRVFFSVTAEAPITISLSDMSLRSIGAEPASDVVSSGAGEDFKLVVATSESSLMSMGAEPTSGDVSSGAGEDSMLAVAASESELVSIADKPVSDAIECKESNTSKDLEVDRHSDQEVGSVDY